MSWFLCGLPKSGKTTVGRLLAARLNYSFVDIDELIEKAHGKNVSCREICGLEGEVAFREWEKKVIRSLEMSDKQVVALGGGSLVDLDNRNKISSLGRLIYLESTLETIWKRLKNSLPSYLNPLQPKEDFMRLSQNRIPIYESLATIRMNTYNHTPEETVTFLLKEIHG